MKLIYKTGVWMNLLYKTEVWNCNCGRVRWPASRVLGPDMEDMVFTWQLSNNTKSYILLIFFYHNSFLRKAKENERARIQPEFCRTVSDERWLIARLNTRLIARLNTRLIAGLVTRLIAGLVTKSHQVAQVGAVHLTPRYISLCLCA